MTLRMDDFKDKRNINRHDRQWEAVELHLMIKQLNIFNGLEKIYQFSSVQFIRSVMFDSLQSHGLQNAMPSCPSPTPGIHLDSRPSSQ